MDKIKVYDVFDVELGRVIARYVKAAGSPEPVSNAQFIFTEREA